MSVEAWLARASVEVPAVSAAPRSRRTQLALGLGVLAALVGAILPLLQVVAPGTWVLGAIGLAAAVLAVGYGARCLRWHPVAVAAVEGVTWLVLLTAAFGGTTTIAWVIPTPSTFALAPSLVAAAVEDISLGAAPLDASTALSFLIVAAVGVLAIAIDHVVLTARMPLLAAVGLVAISLIPSVVVPGDVDLASFILLGGSILFLLRTDTRARQRSRDAVATAAPGAADATASPVTGATATALAIGAIAVVVAVVAAPLLPTPAARAGAGGWGGGNGASIDPTLELGDDLRQPSEVEALRVRTTASTPPYLRVVTLSEFDGAVWQPDERRAVALDDPEALPPVAADADIEMRQYTTTIEVTELTSPWLPVPYAASAVTGLEGDWEAVPSNHTVRSGSTNSYGQAYEVSSTVPRPTAEQIRGREAGGVGGDSADLPAGMPAVIADTAREITAESTNDFDALTALQTWFRGPQFEYSLDAPVRAGFDGSGADAVAEFLDQREGYCVHFASAFALMARSLGMPTRIVVGYLPGTTTGTQTEDRTVYSVASTQLHSWPEVHFEGIGWVPFDPTKSLGLATTFSSGATPDADADTDTAPEQRPEQSAAPTPTASASSAPDDQAEAGGADGLGGGGGAPSPLLGVVLVAVAALLAPALIGVARRRRAAASAEGGDASAAWAAVREQALDLGIAVPAAESPRAFAARLVEAHGAPADAMHVLVHAIERESYAGDADRRAERFGQGGVLADALGRARSGLNRAAGSWPRALAVLAPRSLFVRPGSAFADARARPA